MKDNIAARVILYIEICCFFLQYTFGLSRGYSSYFDLFGFSVAILCVLKMRFTSKGEKWKISIIKLVTVSVLLSLITNFNHFGAGSVITIGRFFIYYLVIEKIKIRTKDRKIIISIFLIQLLLLQMVDKSSYNPNTVGLVYLMLGVCVSLLYRASSLLGNFFEIILFVIIGYLIHMTECRSTLIAFVLYVSIIYFPLNILKQKGVLLSIMLLLTLGSLVYVYIYVYLWENSVLDNDIMTMAVDNTGKDIFSGRQTIWSESLILFHDNILLGTGSNIRLQSFGVVNLHNSLLNFFVINGTIIGLCALYCIIKTVMDIKEFVTNNEIKKCIAAYLSILLVSIFETNLLVFAFMSLLPLYRAYSIKDTIRV